MWETIYCDLNERFLPGAIGQLAARAEAHIVRLALLYALTGRSSSIGLDHLSAALSLWDCAEESLWYLSPGGPTLGGARTCGQRPVLCLVARFGGRTHKARTLVSGPPSEPASQTSYRSARSIGRGPDRAYDFSGVNSTGRPMMPR